MENGAIRVGVFLCDCGDTVSKTIDLPRLAERLRDAPDVAYVEIAQALCSDEGQNAMRDRVLEEKLEGIVVAACSPERYERTFADVLKSTGGHPARCAMANIREHCAWVHTNGKATEKARMLIEMALNRVRRARPVEHVEVPAEPRVLIIGGGPAGMQAALALSRLGMAVTLVERRPELGGRLARLSHLYGAQGVPEEVLSSMRGSLKDAEGIEVRAGAKVIGFNGHVGAFTANVKWDDETLEVKAGAMIVAVGRDAMFDSERYGIGLSDRVVTFSQMEEWLASERAQERPETVGFLLNMSDEHGRLPTLSALKDALLVKDRFKSEVYVFCKQMKTDGWGLERLYRVARDRGAIFFKYDEVPDISTENGRVLVRLKDVWTGGRELVVPCDLLVVEERPIPHPDFDALRTMLKVHEGPGGFYQEDNVHFLPVESNRKGILFAGTCRADLDLMESIADGSVAALRAYELLADGKIVADPIRARVDPEKCALCLTCLRFCPHAAIEVDPAARAARVMEVACWGCGICVAECPAKAIQVSGYTDDQILAQIESLEERI